MALKPFKMYSFIKGLFFKTTNLDLIPDGYFAQGKNGIVSPLGFFEKRQGRGIIGTVIASGVSVYGLIQNQLGNLAYELFCIVAGTIYQFVGGVWTSILTGLQALPTYQEYWQNKVYWGNGSDNIVVRDLQGSTNGYLFVAGNNKVQALDKTFYTQQFAWGSYGTGNSQFNGVGQIAVNNSNVYVVDTGNARVQIFNSNDGTYVSQITGLTGISGIAIDSSYIYISLALTVKRYNISTLAYVDTLTPSLPLYFGGDVATIQSICIDSNNIYISYDDFNSVHGDNVLGRTGIVIYNKSTYVSVNTWISSDASPYYPLCRVAVDDNYIYFTMLYTTLNTNWDPPIPWTGNCLVILNKTTLAFINQIAGNFYDIFVDSNFIYLNLNNTSLQLYGISTFTLVNTLSLTSISGIGESTSSTSLNNFHWLDAPNPPLALITSPTGGSIPTGTYYYKVTYSNGISETSPSQASLAVGVTVGNEVTVTFVGGNVDLIQDTQLQNGTNGITNWNIYRSSDGINFYYLGTQLIANTTYLDILASPTTKLVQVISTLNPFITSNIFTFYQGALWIISQGIIFISFTYEPYFFPANNYFLVDAKSRATGIRGCGQFIIYFTTDEVVVVQGWSISNYQQAIISNSDGAVSNNVIQFYKNTLIFMDTNGIKITDGNTVQKTSEFILDDLFATINPAQYGICSSAIYKDKYYLSVPTGSNTYCDTLIVYDCILKCFYIFTGLNVSSMGLVIDGNNNDQLYIGSIDGATYEMFDGTYGDSDNAGNKQPITLYLQTKSYDLGEPQIQKKIATVYPVCGNDGTNPVNVTVGYQIGINPIQSQAIVINSPKFMTRIRPLSAYGNNFNLSYTESSMDHVEVFGFEAEIQPVKRLIN